MTHLSGATAALLVLLAAAAATSVSAGAFGVDPAAGPSAKLPAGGLPAAAAAAVAPAVADAAAAAGSDKARRVIVTFKEAHIAGMAASEAAAMTLGGRALPAVAAAAAAAPGASGARLARAARARAVAAAARRVFGAAASAAAPAAAASAAAAPEAPKTLEQLPVAIATVTSDAQIAALRADPLVESVVLNSRKSAKTMASLPLISQPDALKRGFDGTGCAVAVIDMAGDYTVPDLGGCAAPGAPAPCRVDAAVDFTGAGFSANVPHGTTVASVVAKVAPGARLLLLNVFQDDGAWDSDILAAIDWVISNADDRGICALNLSLGDSERNVAPCAASPYEGAFQRARAAGVLPIVASGNEYYSDGLPSPACAPSAVSVGAVYDSDVGAYGTCDATTAADKVACFSNVASYMTLLAPGCKITAGGFTFCGTSFAAPHAAGAAAVLRGASKALGAAASAQKALDALVSTGAKLTDDASKLSFPRVNLDAALAAVLADPALALAASPSPSPSPVPSPSPSPSPVPSPAPADTTPPTGTVVLNRGAKVTNADTVLVEVTASDDSGADGIQMCVDTRPGPCGAAWGPVAPRNVRLAAADGPQSVFVSLRDRAGNAAAPIEASIVRDTRPPSASVSIVGVAAATNKAQVTLAIAGSHDPNTMNGVTMCISNTATCTTAFVPFAATAAWTLAPGDGPKAVRVWLRDPAGNAMAAPAVANVLLDTTAPAVTAFAINGGAQSTPAAAVTLTIAAADAAGGAGGVTMCVSESRVCAGPFVPLAASLLWTLSAAAGPKTVYVTVQDSLGNRAAPRAASIAYAPPPPTGSLSFVGSTASTRSRSVRVQLSSPTATMACVSANDTADMASCNVWRALPASFFVVLADGNGPRTVRAVFRSAAGVLSAVVPATITLDQAAPDMTNAAARATAAAAGATLSWAPAGVTDAGSGVAYYIATVAAGALAPPPRCVAGSGAVAVAVPAGAAVSSAPVSGLARGRTYRARLCAVDAAGNVAAGVVVPFSTAK